MPPAFVSVTLPAVDVFIVGACSGGLGVVLVFWGIWQLRPLKHQARVAWHELRRWNRLRRLRRCNWRGVWS